MKRRASTGWLWRHRLFSAAAFCLKVLFLAGLGTGFLAGPARAAAIKVGGTGGALGLVKLLVVAFEQDRPAAHIIVLPSLGSTGGIKALIRGDIDMALSSRPLRPTEKTADLRKIELAKTPFVFAVSTRMGINALSRRELAEIYGGRPTWPDGSRIRLVLRPAWDSDTTIIRGVSAAMDKAVSAALTRRGMIFAVTDQASAAAIEKGRGAIGTSTLALILSEQRAIKPLTLDGVTPSPRTIADRSYPYIKTYNLVVKDKPAGLVRDFAAFIGSATGREILRRNGCLVAGATGK